MDWQARWIWCAGEASPRNRFVTFRKTFRLAAVPAAARLQLTADSRYRLFVNGEWLGDGPPRSWPDRQTCDTYDVAAYLRRGVNVVAVLVTHYGESTFQYLVGRGGLLAQLELDGGRTIRTDRTWRARPSRAFQRPTARISCQMGFEEVFDARRDTPGWTQPDFADGGWPRAVEIGPAGMAPWTRLQPRDIPFLTRTPMEPAQVVRVRAVRPDAQVTTLDLRPTLFAGDRTANHARTRAVYFTELVSPAAQKVTFPACGATNHAELLVNGRHIAGAPADDGPAVPLRQGANLVALVMAGGYHWSAHALAVRAGKPVRFRLPGNPKANAHWWFAGPFGEDETQDWERVRRCRSAAELVQLAPRGRPVPPADHIPCNPYAVTRTQTAVDAPVRVDAPDALLVDTADWTTVHPGRADTELLLDFGEELVGYIEFDLDAPAGAVVDVLCFEAIEDGRIHYPDGNQNSLRYVCRDGRQQFTTFVRHGFRYAFVTLRDHRRPVRIRQVRALRSVYPAALTGAFRCSDPRLDKIWEVGRRTLLLCAEDTFTDCPGYEQTYWVGDGRNEAMVSYAVWGPTALVRRCVDLPAHSLSRSELPESQVPSGWQDIIPAWSLLWLLMVEEYYRYSGDTAALRAVYPAVRKTLRRCKKRCTDHGLFSFHGWNLFDWAPQDTGSPTVVHNSMFLAGALERAAFLANTLGKREDERWFRAFRRELVSAINAVAWSEKQGAYVDALHPGGRPSDVVSQQTNSLALLYDVAPPARAARIADWPAAPPRGAVTVGSPFALFYILEALAAQGRHDTILAIVRERWGMMLGKGATTFWETFPGFDSAWWTRSHCHAWSAAPTYFLTAYQLGVTPLVPGCGRVRIAPQPVDLEWAEGIQPTPRGPVHVSWRKERGAFSLSVQLPAGVAAELLLPVEAGDYPNVTVNGRACRTTQAVPGVGRLVRRDNRWRLETRAGVSVELLARR